MIRHYLLVLYRSLARHPLYAALNIIGLAAGIAVFVTLSLVVLYENGFDRWLPEGSRTYRVDSTFLNPGQPPLEGGYASFAMVPYLITDFPQIEAITRSMPRDSVVSVGSTMDSEQVTYVDPSFLRTVGLPLLSGDPATALAHPGSVVIDAAAARKYFGTTNAVGRTLDIAISGDKHTYAVSAVMRPLPQDTSMKFGMLAPLTPAMEQSTDAFTHWGSSSGQVYLRLRNEADVASIRAALRDFVHRRASGSGPEQIGPNAETGLVLSLIALPSAHFHDVGVETLVPGADRRVVWSLGAVGVMALLTAAINYVNLATARAGLRAREVAMRKVVGATRSVLLGQFLGEALVVVALAALIGLAMVEIALPVVNALGGWDVRLRYAQVLPWLAVTVVVIGFGAGAYPALLLAGFRPAAVLASARAPAGGRMGMRLRNLLVLAQFASAIAFAICTLVIDAQAALLRNADRGFERNGLIIVRSLSGDELMPRQHAVLDAFRATQGVVAATLSDREPNSDSQNDTTLRIPGRPGDPPSIVTENVTDGYLQTYGVHLIAGRWFDTTYRQDALATASTNASTVISRSALAMLGVSSPQAAIGRVVQLDSRTHPTNLRIVGVVQDVRFMSPRQPVTPQLYLFREKPVQYAEAAVRFAGVPRTEMLRRLTLAWHGVVPEEPLVAGTADERLADFYQPDQQRARLFSAGAILAVAIACIGLYGLASFSTARRMQEIGIRKVLGASTRDVLLLLVGQFIRPVLIAAVIAWPIAWIAMRGWLAGFDTRVALSPLYFLAATAVALGIAVATVLGQAWRVAQAEPARALRYE